MGLERKDRLEVFLLRAFEELERLTAVLVVLLDVHLLAGANVAGPETDDLAVVGLLLEQVANDEAIPRARAHELLRAIALAGDDEQYVLVLLDREVIGQRLEELDAFLIRRLPFVPVLPGTKLVERPEGGHHSRRAA